MAPLHIDSEFTAPPPRRIGALALLRNRDGHVGMVKKTYGRKAWGLVGGLAKPGEHAAAACQRETLEETGLRLVPGAVLVVHHMPAAGEVKEGYNVVFDCHVHDNDTSITLPGTGELEEFRWLDATGLDELEPYQRWRIQCALGVLRGELTVPFISGHPSD